MNSDRPWRRNTRGAAYSERLVSKLRRPVRHARHGTTRIEWVSTIPISRVSDDGQMPTSPMPLAAAGRGDKWLPRLESLVARAIQYFAGTLFVSAWRRLILGYPIDRMPRGRSCRIRSTFATQVLSLPPRGSQCAAARSLGRSSRTDTTCSCVPLSAPNGFRSRQRHAA